MAGTIIADKIQTENAFLTLNVGQTLVATINSSGILNSSGGTMIGANGSVSNTAITGLVTASQIANVANTQITGTITGSQISSNTLSNTVFQTGSVENYMSAQGTSFGIRNKLINGAMMISQRNGTSTITPADGDYVVDRWSFGVAQSSKLTSAQSSTAPSGFSNSVLVTSSSAFTPGSTDLFRFTQKIEGFNTVDLAFGTASAKSVTLTFWVQSSLTGTFGGSLQNNAGDRSYPFTYTISTANTWEQKSLTITGDTTGTWIGATNGIGLYVNFSLGAGSSRIGTAGAWAAAGYYGATGQVNLVSTNAATWYITGVQLEKSSTATPFEYRPYGKELMLCQRYFQVAGDNNNRIPAFCGNSTNGFTQNLLVCPMRAQPSLTLTGAMDFDEYYVSGRVQSSSSISRNSGGTNFVIATFGNLTGLTRGNPGALYSATYVLKIDAEL